MTPRIRGAARSTPPLAGAPIVAAIAATAIVATTQPRTAAAEPAISGVLVAGIDEDTSAIGRLLAGGLYSFGRIAPELHLGFDGFLRIDSDRGTAARSLTLIDLGVRYGFLDDRFVGPYAALGGSFGVFVSSPNERKLVDDSDTCATAAEPDACTYFVDRNLTARLALGWGFPSGDSATVGVRLDITYWAFSVSPGEDQPLGAPIAREIPRPQDAWSVLVGFEFIRWL